VAKIEHPANPSAWVISAAVRTNQVTLRERVGEAIDVEVRDSLWF